MLECAKLKRKRESTETEDEHCRPKRQSGMQRVCIFCDKITSEQLHEIMTLNVDKSIQSMAIEMSDHELLVKISGGDLIALEAKYHLSCLTIYRNRYRTFSTQNAARQASKQARGRAFSEVVVHIDDALSQGIYFFKLGELCTAYEQRIKYFISDATMNKTRFKCELLDYYKQYGIQEQTDGRHVVLIFPKGMKTIVQNACFTSHCTLEASQLASVAKLLRSEISDMDNFTFDGNFPYDCQKDSVPYSLKLLISMILYGPSVDCIDTQSCLTISQLILFNFKKKQRIDFSKQPPHPEFDSKVFDGAAVVHFLPTSTANTFAEYANRIFIPFLLQQLQDAERIDCVWDRYLVSSIKDSTREHRGSGTRTKVSAQTKLPKKWGDFLRDSRNKTELFAFLSERTTNSTVPEGKLVFITSGRFMIFNDVCMCYDYPISL